MRTGDLQITFGNGYYHITELVGPRRWVYRFSNRHADDLGEVLAGNGFQRVRQLDKTAIYHDLVTGYYSGGKFE